MRPRRAARTLERDAEMRSTSPRLVAVVGYGAPRSCVARLTIRYPVPERRRRWALAARVSDGAADDFQTNGRTPLGAHSARSGPGRAYRPDRLTGSSASQREARGLSIRRPDPAQRRRRESEKLLGISSEKAPLAMAFRNALPPREQALTELAMCDPADLSKVQKLRVIHSRCAQAGVLTGASVSSASATAHAASAAGDGASDVAKLHQLFDAAVANGMPQLVCHYVDEVCGHDDFSSPDGVEAYLQDGEMVAEWAASSLRSAEQALDQAAALRTQGAADEVDRAGAVFEALRDVLVALGADPAAGGDSAEAADAATSTQLAQLSADGSPGFQRRLQLAHDDAARRMQHAAALSWALREGLVAGAAASQDRYGGPAQWASEVTVRRAAAAAAAAADLPPDADGGGLFLDDLLAGVGVHAPPYPFKSATEAAERVFRHGSAAPAALVAKQSLFLYYLLDAGLPPDGAPARFASHVRLHPRLFVETRCAALLDDHSRGSSLELACAPAPRRFAPRFATPVRRDARGEGKAGGCARRRQGAAERRRRGVQGQEPNAFEWNGRRRGYR